MFKFRFFEVGPIWNGKKVEMKPHYTYFGVPYMSVDVFHKLQNAKSDNRVIEQWDEANEVWVKHSSFTEYPYESPNQLMLFNKKK